MKKFSAFIISLAMFFLIIGILNQGYAKEILDSDLSILERETINDGIKSPLPFLLRPAAIAFGIILENGTVYKGRGIESVTLESTGRYSIKIKDINYYYLDYITIGTAIGSEGYILTTSSMGGVDLLIFLTDTDGNKVNGTFYFISYGFMPFPSETK